MIGQAERVAELRRLQQKALVTGLNKVITFTSGKGGTGKTFTAVNTAFLLSKLGARVLLIDFDTNLSNINILLNYHPQTTIFQYLQKQRLFNEVIVNYAENFDIIFGDSGRVEYPEPDEKLTGDLMRGIEKVEDDYDFIILDTASGAGNGIVSLLCKCDINIIVATPEPTAVMDAYVLVKLLKANGYRKEKYVLFNKCINQSSAETGFDNLINACRHFLGEELSMLGSIQFTQEATQSIIDQKLIAESMPEAQITAQLNEIAARILKFKQLANINQAIAG